MNIPLYSFPLPYPGESYYSVLCRCHLRSGNASSAYTMTQLFHHGIDLSKTILFPAYLDLLPSWTFPDYACSEKQILLKHTALPLRFLNKQYLDLFPVSIPALIKSDKAKFFHRELIHSPDKALRFCPKCAREQKILYGESFWQLLPQLDGVEFCPIHKERIMSSGIRVSRYSTKFIPASAVLDDISPVLECSSGSWYSESDIRKFPQLFISMAESYAWLLAHGNSYIGIWQVLSRYRTLFSRSDAHSWFDARNVKSILIKKNNQAVVNWLFLSGIHGFTPNYIFFGGLPITAHVLMMVLLMRSAKRFFDVKETGISL